MSSRIACLALLLGTLPGVVSSARASEFVLRAFLARGCLGVPAVRYGTAPTDRFSIGHPGRLDWNMDAIGLALGVPVGNFEVALGLDLVESFPALVSHYSLDRGAYLPVYLYARRQPMAGWWGRPYPHAYVGGYPWGGDRYVNSGAGLAWDLRVAEAGIELSWRHEFLDGWADEISVRATFGLGRWFRLGD